MVTDRLSVANALEAANIDRPVAERIATELYDGIHNNVATKADLAQLRMRLRWIFYSEAPAAADKLLILLGRV